MLIINSIYTCVYMYIHIYIYIYPYTHTYTSLSIYFSLSLSLCIYIYMYLHIYIHTHSFNTPLKADPERPTTTLGRSPQHPRGIIKAILFLVCSMVSRSGWHGNRGAFTRSKEDPDSEQICCRIHILFAGCLNKGIQTTIRQTSKHTHTHITKYKHKSSSQSVFPSRSTFSPASDYYY